MPNEYYNSDYVVRTDTDVWPSFCYILFGNYGVAYCSDTSAYLNVDEQYAFLFMFYERQLNKHIPDDVQFNVDCNRACDGFYASLWLVKRRQFHIGTTTIFYDIWVYFFCGSENKYVSGFLLNCWWCLFWAAHQRRKLFRAFFHMVNRATFSGFSLKRKRNIALTGSLCQTYFEEWY